MDLYSRKIVGYEIYENESSENLATVLKRATLNEGSLAPSVLHSDNGSPMKGTTLVALCYLLGIAASYSRPRTSQLTG
ncbi:integrase core domain protein [Acidithrix ferrooxidans]|uniref:Integrase core domain protein n=2 Tax=Acidithrix ferrooxidans TaxID=1280514 RepID=A0A0D8HC27_9ACTN|nr:integrase core domain protein [Acidithrix ferrooxidans]